MSAAKHVIADDVLTQPEPLAEAAPLRSVVPGGASVGSDGGAPASSSTTPEAKP